ncbi:MAG: hypothetical protein UT12_C0007G0020 [Candidatus Curtissbacteria bacterium GW2011_GWC2_38_9]|nr:MAG: hypothetical protein UT12_C0007G0020 [Candidatus Curtissbacteria bacterium GW2011_GWC2_38_9]KKS04451.1 MAG: hypothetical protein UU56_C0006G0055 [Candidatus Curtissbacteria bacterium GW2011_GWA2_41_24]
MYIYPRFVQHYVKNKYEPFSSEIIKNYLKPNSTFVDLGAHFGYYSLLAYHSQKNTKIIAIEPVKKNFEVLKKNIKLNNVKNAKLYNFAASNKKEVKDFNLTEASDSAGFYEHPLTKTKKIIKIKSYPPDQILKKKKIDFIKIDIEGHEMAVLEGLKTTLKNNKNLSMLVEFNPKMQKNAGFQPDDLLKKLESLGFEIFLIDELKRKYYRLTNNKYSWQEFINENSYANLLCIPKQKSLFVTYFSHRANLGGAVRSHLDLLNQIKKFDALSHVVIPSNGPFVDRIKNKAVSFDIVPFGWWVSKGQASINERHFNSLINITGYLDELKRINPHLIYTNTLVIPWGALSAFLLNKPHLWHIREFGKKDHGFSFDMTLKESVRLINLLSEKVIYNSKAVQHQFKNYIDPNRGETVYNSIEIPEELLKEKVKQVYKSKKSLKLIIAGFIAKSKGQDQAIKATMRLLDEGYDVELLVLGSFSKNDPYFISLNNLIKTKKTNKIYFENNVLNPYPYINQSDILLICSRSEASSRTLVEAMLLKKPVIGSDKGGALEQIKEGYNGFLYNYEDINDLKQKILYFLKNRKMMEVMGQNGLTFAKSKFSPEKYAGKIMKIMMTLKNKKIKRFENSKDFLQSFLLHQLKLNDTVKEIEIHADQNMNLIKEIDQTEKSITDLSQKISSVESAKIFRTWKLTMNISKVLLKPISIASTSKN